MTCVVFVADARSSSWRGDRGAGLWLPCPAWLRPPDMGIDMPGIQPEPGAFIIMHRQPPQALAGFGETSATPRRVVAANRQNFIVQSPFIVAVGEAGGLLPSVPRMP